MHRPGQIRAHSRIFTRGAHRAGSEVYLCASFLAQSDEERAVSSQWINPQSCTTNQRQRHLRGADGGGGQREAEGREDEERRREPAGHLCIDEGALSFVTAICSPVGILHTNESGEAE